LPPNFATFYKIEDVSGYDPLYLKTYGELVAAWTRGKPDISPASFNRILTPQDYSSPIADLLNVKYVLSLKEEKSQNLKLVSREGQTYVYENLNVFPRIFFVENIKSSKDKNEAIKELFSNNLRKTAVVIDNDLKSQNNFGLGSINILDYKENSILLETDNKSDGFLVMTDIFYPTWKAKIDNQLTKIYLTDYAFRGIFVPKGKHEINFSISLF